MADFVDGDYMALGTRKLTEETCRKFGYRVGRHNGVTVQVADYRTQDGTLVAQKLRTQDKKFSVVGVGKDMPLFGQHLWGSSGSRVVVTEGELDAMSVAQVFGLSWPVVSLPNGAQSARKALQGALEWLDGYGEVVLMFDMDEPGRQAAASAADLFTPGKCKIAELPLKDASEMLQADRGDELRKAVYQARVYRPDGIVTLDEIEERVMRNPEMGRSWFLSGLNEATYGRRPGELIGLGAGTGVGKTDWFTQSIAHDVMQLGLRVGVLYLEQGVGETGRRIAGKVAHRRFHVPDGSWTMDELEAAWGALKSTGRLFLFDCWGAMDAETVLSRIRYMVKALECQHIYLDHLTALAAAADDERVALEKIMAALAGLAQSTGAIIHFVSHLATPDGTPHEEGGRVMIRHFKGSRAIGFWSHMLLGLERDQQAEDPEARSRTTLRVLKDRSAGNATGQTWQLRYDQHSGLLREAEFAPAEEDGDVPF